MRSHFRNAGLLAILLSAASVLSVAADLSSELAQLKTTKGICVVVAIETTDLPIKMVEQTELIIYVHSSNAEVVSSLRRTAASRGYLGTRIYVEHGAANHLPLADNLADAVMLLSGERSQDLQEEFLRVTHPGAKILTSLGTTSKPRPNGADDWSHPYHGPDNNPQSRDHNSQGPYLTQFLAEPWYVPMPQVTVTSGGRVFKAFGHIALKEREWPWLNKLVAINGYNGTMLWNRDLTPGFMIHRSTLIATPEALYLGDDESCKLIDAATGELRDEIKIPTDVDPDGVWKWMALQDGVLYALVGPAEQPDTVIRGGRTQAGWPWSDLGEGYSSEYSWGFGRVLLAIRPESKEILWTYRSELPIDSRAMCIAAGKAYVYSHQKYVAAVDIATGSEVWKTSDSKLLAAIGQHDRAQTASKGFASSAYAKANHQGVYFAGPQRTNLVAVSARDGSLLWSYPHGNFQLVLRDDGLYAMGRLETSKKFDYLTGKIIADLECYRGNCTRATATPDSIFTRGYRHTGTMRLDLSGNSPRRIALMRPACQDGVIIADGQLYWGPWMCDCNHSLIGMISLAPSGNFDFAQQATDEERLTEFTGIVISERVATPRDWPSYRGDAQRTAASASTVTSHATQRWTQESTSGSEPTAPIAVGDLTYWSGLDGVVHAANVVDGKAAWEAYTGGAVRFPPEYWNGRVYVGSSDGYVYCFDATNGHTLWKFRAAPIDRKIAVHGRLLSNWPVGSGVLVDDGVVYAAAGITSYDGTHVYALDAITGELRWQNNDSSRLTSDDGVTGISVQGHLLLHENRLYLAGGNVVSPAIYDPVDGRCLNELKNEWWEGLPDADVRFPSGADSKMFNRSPRGRELFVVDGSVKVFDQLLYSPPKYGPSRYFGGHFLQAGPAESIVRGTTDRVVRLSKRTTAAGEPIGVWQSAAFRDPVAIAVCQNAVIVAGELTRPESSDTNAASYAVSALSIQDGSPLWSEQLPAVPVSWGLAVDRNGHVVVTLVNGTVVCVGQP
ncbi:MAG: PQQ-binding-like beta-propeller repeat protein [Planctomycetales bacterium]|nr:PQQ-binding-like beta-propeller repeat protein [Planctomycetales bacterium]